MSALLIDRSSDWELMRRVADGDTAAFDAIYRRYRKQALTTAARITKRPTAAEEVAQDAFLSLWRSAWRYDPSRGNLNTWLLSLVRNRGIDALRKGARHEGEVEFDDELAAGLAGPDRTEEVVAQRDWSGQLRALLTELPAEQREVIELLYFGELTHAEVARKIEIPLGTVKGRQRLALLKLHRALTGEHRAVAA